VLSEGFEKLIDAATRMQIIQAEISNNKKNVWE
jgi:hypothetical protein